MGKWHEISPSERDSYLSSRAKKLAYETGISERDAAAVLADKWGWELPKKYTIDECLDEAGETAST